MFQRCRIAGAVAVIAGAVALSSSVAAGGPQGTVEICHFPSHVQQSNPEQIDFILDTGLPPEERVAECTDRDGIVISVNGNAVSPASDDIRRGHEIDG